MKNINCAYCMKDDNPELYQKFGYFAFEMKTSNVYIFKEQSKIGRCIIAYKEHVSEIVDLSDDERNDFFKDVNELAKGIHKAFNPDKINYGAYGDTGGHLHFHLCPKYNGGSEWGGIFQMNPGNVVYSDSECEELKNKLIEAMNKEYIK